MAGEKERRREESREEKGESEKTRFRLQGEAIGVSDGGSINDVDTEDPRKKQMRAIQILREQGP